MLVTSSSKGPVRLRVRPQGLEKGTKLWNDIRDRLAYVHLTGALPTHLRELSSEYIRRSVMRGERANFPWAVKRPLIDTFELSSHPMVTKVRAFQRRGWKLAQQEADRRGYHRVYMTRWDSTERAFPVLAIKVDGSILED